MAPEPTITQINKASREVSSLILAALQTFRETLPDSIYIESLDVVVKDIQTIGSCTTQIVSSVGIRLQIR